MLSSKYKVCLPKLFFICIAVFGIGFLNIFCIHASAKTPSITVQGDSLTVMSQPFLKNQLKSWQMDYSAKSGRHADQALYHLRNQKIYPVVVFALGTNDTGYNLSWFKNKIHQVRKLVKSNCLIIPTVYNTKPASKINNYLHYLRDRYKNVKLIPWSTWFSQGRIPSFDGVHPSNNIGLRLRAKAIAQKARQCI